MHKTFIIESIFNVPLQTKTAFLDPLIWGSYGRLNHICLSVLFVMQLLIIIFFKGLHLLVSGDMDTTKTSPKGSRYMSYIYIFFSYYFCV